MTPLQGRNAPCAACGRFFPCPARSRTLLHVAAQGAAPGGRLHHPPPRCAWRPLTVLNCPVLTAQGQLSCGLASPCARWPGVRWLRLAGPWGVLACVGACAGDCGSAFQDRPGVLAFKGPCPRFAAGRTNPLSAARARSMPCGLSLRPSCGPLARELKTG